MKRVENKTEELNTLQEDMKSMKGGMEDITKIVLHLENFEGNVVEEIKKHLARIQEEEAQKRILKEKMLADIAEEEKCCIVI